MERYVFSSNISDKTEELLSAKSDFQPLDYLVTQIDRSGVAKAIERKRKGFIRWLMIDSGAFSVWTGRSSTTIDEYIEYLNSIDDDVDFDYDTDTD